jgi:hypothetical protein
MNRNKKIGEKRMALRQQVFPHIDDTHLWLRAVSTGFTTIPRALPLLLMLMDRMSKGKPVSNTYFELWCRMFDECFVNLKPREMAYHAGFTGQRAEQTWSERMKILQKLKFIEVRPGPEGELSYAVVLNPYKVLKNHFAAKNPALDVAAYNALIQRATEIGADDLDDPKPVIGPVPPDRAKIQQTVPLATPNGRRTVMAPTAPPPSRRAAHLRN